MKKYTSYSVKQSLFIGYWNGRLQIKKDTLLYEIDFKNMIFFKEKQGLERKKSKKIKRTSSP